MKAGLKLAAAMFIIAGSIVAQPAAAAWGPDDLGVMMASGTGHRDRGAGDVASGKVRMAWWAIHYRSSKERRVFGGLAVQPPQRPGETARWVPNPSPKCQPDKMTAKSRC